MTTDGNGRFGYLNPRVGGQIAVLEAAANVIAKGAQPLAITDCLNFGDPMILKYTGSFTNQSPEWQNFAGNLIPQSFQEMFPFITKIMVKQFIRHQWLEWSD